MSIALLKNVLFPAERKRPQSPAPVVNTDSQTALALPSRMPLPLTCSSCKPHVGSLDSVT